MAMRHCGRLSCGRLLSSRLFSNGVASGSAGAEIEGRLGDVDVHAVEFIGSIASADLIRSIASLEIARSLARFSWLVERRTIPAWRWRTACGGRWGRGAST